MRTCLGLLYLILLSPVLSADGIEIYVVDVGPNRGPPYQVMKYDENGENPEVFIDTELNRPQDIVFLEHEGTAIVSNLISGRITKYDANSGAFVGDFASGIGQPTRMEIGQDNLLYVLQWQGNGKVWRYDLDGNFVDEFTSVGVSNSIGLDWDRAGNLYVASFDGRHVRRFNNNGRDMGLFTTTNLQGPTNIWFEDNGDLMVMDWNGRAVRRFNSNGVFQGNFITGLSEPEGIDFLDNGNLLIGDGGSSSVRQYTRGGDYVGDFIPPGSGGLAKPNAVRIRRTSSFDMNAGLNGNWWSGPARNGEGVQIEIAEGEGGQTVFVATVYSYNDQGGQIFLVAVGDVSGDTAEVTVYITKDGRWGSDFNPDDVDTIEWGSGLFKAGGCGAVSMSLRPNAAYKGLGYTDMDYELIRLTTSLLPCPMP
jgi:sugar lactone lactonase YvrE